MLPIVHGTSKSAPSSRSIVNDVPVLEADGGKVEPSFYDKSRSSNPKSMPQAAKVRSMQKSNKSNKGNPPTNRAVGLSATNIVVDEKLIFVLTPFNKKYDDQYSEIKKVVNAKL